MNFLNEEQPLEGSLDPGRGGDEGQSGPGAVQKETVAPGQRLTIPHATTRVGLVSRFLLFHVDLPTLLFSTESLALEPLFSMETPA